MLAFRLSPSRPPGDDGAMEPDPDEKPVLPAQSEEEAGVGWGDAAERDDEERLREDRPPHWDQ